LPHGFRSRVSTAAKKIAGVLAFAVRRRGKGDFEVELSGVAPARTVLVRGSHPHPGGRVFLRDGKTGPQKDTRPRGPFGGGGATKKRKKGGNMRGSSNNSPRRGMRASV